MEIQIGDIVKITQKGFIYDRYAVMFEKFKLNNLLENKLPLDTFGEPDPEGVWCVIGMSLHEKKNQGMLYALQRLNSDIQVVINGRGIEKIST